MAGCTLIGTLAGPPSPANAATGPAAATPSTSTARHPAPARVAPGTAAAPVTAEPGDASCRGPLTFGQIVDCPAFEAGERHVYTVTTTVDNERVANHLVERGTPLRAALTGSDGTQICTFFLAPMECVVPKAGTYTVTVVKRDVDSPRKTGASAATGYLLGVDSWTNPSDCVDLPAEAFAITAPGRDDRLPAGSAGRCYRFEQAAGAVVRITTRGGTNLSGHVENATGEMLCRVSDEKCRLRGPGPYRLLLTDWDGSESSYHLSTMRLTNPDGCTETAPTPFGAPDDRTGSAVLGGDTRVTCRTFTAAVGQYLFASDPQRSLYWQVIDPSGSKLACPPQLFGVECRLPTKGTYTALLSDHSGEQPRTVRLAIFPLAGTEGCESVLRTTRTTPLITVTMRSRLQVDCHRIDADPGDRLRVFTTATTWLTNGAGSVICAGQESGEAGCPLTGAGPHRLISIGRHAQSSSYTLHARVLSDANGCVPVRPGSYGAGPAGELTANPCRSLIVPAAARYRVELVDEKNNRATARVVDSAGKPVCDTGWCTFPAAGRYKLVAKTDTTRYATVFLPEAGSSGDGCTPVSDEPTADAQNVSLFSAGQYDCLLLPTPAGASLALLSRYEIKAADFPELSVYDATGKPACDLARLIEPSCVLEGTAPFHAVMHLGDKADKTYGSYPIAFVRTGGTPACPALAAGSFATTASTKVTLEGQRAVVGCFTVPASEHTGAELFSLSRTEPVSIARLSVFGEDGKLICRTKVSGADFALCRLRTGAVTVLVEGFGAFSVARRDVTGSAAGCRQVGSTAVGAPAATGALTPDVNVHCHQVAAEPADQVMIDARNFPALAEVLVLDPAGAEAGCAAPARNCTVTGRTGYQILVWSKYVFGDTPYAFDVWRVWTADGPPRECQPIPSGAYGFGPYTGTLDASKRAACAVTTRHHDDDFAISVTNPVTPADGFRSARMYAVTGSAGPQSCTGTDRGRFTCPPGRETVEPTAFLLSLGNRTAANPYRWEATCAKPLCGGNAFTVTAVSPTTLKSGETRLVTISGTSLHEHDTVRVTPAGGVPVTATVRTVSADRTVMTAEVNLTSAPAGPASVEVRSYGADVGPVVVPDALDITTPPMEVTRPPAVTGRAAVGEKVTASTGGWSPTPTSYAYQWAANGTAIRGATGRSYVIPAAVLGKALTVTVTATRAGYAPGKATSAPSAPVAKGAAPKATKKPAIKGTARVGHTVRADTGAWSSKPSAYRYEWRINGRVVRGASRATLKLTASMRNKRLTVTVIAARTGHLDGKAQSKPVTVRR